MGERCCGGVCSSFGKVSFFFFFFFLSFLFKKTFFFLLRGEKKGEAYPCYGGNIDKPHVRDWLNALAKELEYDVREEGFLFFFFFFF